MNVMILDAGNAVIKAKNAKGEVSYPHALKTLTETEYNNILTRSGRQGPPADYVKINGQAYVVGDSAERHGTLTRRSGAARYTADYYGVFVAATMARLFDRNTTVAIFGSHPPGDVDHRGSLMQAALGDWDVEVGGKTLHFKIDYANTFDEPLGGLFNVVLAADGKHYARSDINGGRALVIDIGGHTTDWLSVNPGGEIDYSLNESTPIGINEVIRDFERSFKANNREAMKSLSSLPPDRVRIAISSGVFTGGGREYPCAEEVAEATNVLINQIGQTYQSRAGGPIPWDTIVLTGGGSAMLYEKLQPILEHEHVILADDAATIHMANARGGLKYWRLLEAMDLL
jgi:hypothetical protein